MGVTGTIHRFNYPDVLSSKNGVLVYLERPDQEICLDFRNRNPPPLALHPLSSKNGLFYVFRHAEHFCQQLRTRMRYQFKLNAAISRTARPQNYIQ